MSSPELKLLEVTQVSPPAGAAPATTLPLTFSDVLFYRIRPVQRLFLFQLPPSAATADLLPDLKRSLSLALARFFPLAGTLLCPHPSGEPPCLSYVPGDSVTLSVYESSDDFPELAGGSPLLSSRLHCLVPDLPASRPPAGSPILALQITLFPAHGGLGLGVTTNHGAADGYTSVRFIRAWAAIHRSGADDEGDDPPVLDRSSIADPEGLLQTYLTAWAARGPRYRDAGGGAEVVRMAFVMTGAQLDVLRRRAAGAPSAFAAACGAAWASMVRARWGRGWEGAEVEQFLFVSDCRGRGVTKGYVGNALLVCKAKAGRAELAGDGGATAATEAVWAEVERLRRGEGMRGAERWTEELRASAETGAFSVSGSPRHGVYRRVDFGWGRARRVEVVSVEARCGMCIAESRDEAAGGCEIGIGLPAPLMEAFAAALADVLAGCSNK